MPEEKEAPAPQAVETPAVPAAMPGEPAMEPMAESPEPTPPPEAPKEVRRVSVRFESDPTNSDVEINGLYVGSTPIQISLPEGGVHFIRIVTVGYLPWETRIKAYNGLEVMARLAKEVTRSENSKVSTEAK